MSWLGVFFTTFLIFVGFVIYFLPWLVARDRRHANVVSIFVLNLLLGWSLIGWVVALVWAFAKLSTVPPDDDHEHPQQRLCPYCAEPIAMAAIKCKHCGSDLTAV